MATLPTTASTGGSRAARVILGAIGLAWALGAQAQVTYSAAGANAAALALTTEIANFRAALGALNLNTAGSVGSGRREINWDGVPDASAAPNNLPANFFNVNSPRGVVFSTPGTGFQVSANAVNISSAAVEFGNINPSYPALFAPFTAQRLFTALGSNILDVRFFVPGDSTPALTRGFGAVFADVDLADTTSLHFFGAGDVDLGTFHAQASGGNEGFSFLGVLFPAAQVARVRITSGNGILSSGSNETATVDMVVMDDFIYGEPIAAIAAIPEPGTWALMLAGIGALGAVGRRRRLRG